ncbi:RNA ligase RtcB family protein [Kordiimonas sp. SCSIO 12610]|uniref:RNA ligase RtcB family protein n=1 Tax=Kordiimonas sp. SCSIO 12610 TaxID=2829597 RepID=UPI00210D3759|nr:RNA ligase RtcB family protein [Kordiimonas sp. SCSIO 12610]UTW56310.1 RNA ligase RtcB family protein [Kordiimonas sp. SCSIO 12610]
MNDITKTHIVASKSSWIEGEAVRQLEQMATLDGMVRAVGMPDLHPGKGTPVGAAFESSKVIYPHLVGNDIGCGMGLWQTDILNRKVKLDRFVKNLSGLEQPWTGNISDRLQLAGLTHEGAFSPLGTIGGGNHFAELQKLEKVYDQSLFDGLGLVDDKAALLIHSGSRGLGEAILRSHIAKYAGEPLHEGTDDFSAYINRHDDAVKWAIVNREVIADRFLDCLNASGTRVLDICHNSVTPYGRHWLHRKGAAPSDKGAVVIPGSRGAITYVVQPVRSAWDMSLCSLAHGAGRRWKRSEVKAKLSKRYKVNDLTQTKLGGRVICEDKDLIFEEAPEAYKDIEQVMTDLADAGLVKLIASYRPLITYKTRRV